MGTTTYEEEDLLCKATAINMDNSIGLGKSRGHLEGIAVW